MSRVGYLAAGMLIACGLVSCDGHGSSARVEPLSRAQDGPLGAPGTSHSIVCDVGTPQAPVTFEVATLQVSGHQDVRIERVRFYRVHNLHIGQAFIVPIAGDSIGYSSTYPPSRAITRAPGVRWNARVAAQGAVLHPTSGLHAYSLFFEMESTGARSDFVRADVLYSSAGREYISHGGLSGVFPVRPQGCTSSLNRWVDS